MKGVKEAGSARREASMKVKTNPQTGGYVYERTRLKEETQLTIDYVYRHLHM